MSFICQCFASHVLLWRIFSTFLGRGPLYYRAAHVISLLLVGSTGYGTSFGDNMRPTERQRQRRVRGREKERRNIQFISSKGPIENSYSQYLNRGMFYINGVCMSVPRKYLVMGQRPIQHLTRPYRMVNHPSMRAYAEQEQVYVFLATRKIT